MTQTALTTELIEQVRNLSDADRTALFEQTNGQEYTEEELQEEILSRLEDYQAGRVESYSLDEVMTKLRQAMTQTRNGR